MLSRSLQGLDVMSCGPMAFVAGAIIMFVAPLAEGQGVGAAGPVGSDPFVRYTTPGQCEQAAIRLRRQYWRTRREDTVRYAPATDSVPASVVAAARACAARFDVRTVPDQELFSLVQLYLWAQQPTLVDAVVNRLQTIEAKRSPAEWGWTWYLLTTSALNTRPASLPRAQRYLRELDAKGASVALWRLFAHTAVAQYALSINDRELADREGHAGITASFASSVAERQDWIPSIFTAYQTLAKAIAFHETPAQGKAAVLHLFERASPTLEAIFADSSPDRRRMRNAFADEARPYILLGLDTLPPLHGDFWYDVKGYTNRVDSPTVPRPRRGTVSLLVFVDASCGSLCYPMYATMRRLYTKHANASADGTPAFEIILLASTQGYFRQTLISAPHAEADSVGSYFRTFLKLPASVTIEATSFFHIADGRRQNVEPANHKIYYRDRDAVLIDQHGTVRWLDDLSPQSEAIWDAEIGRVLQETTH